MHAPISISREKFYFGFDDGGGVKCNTRERLDSSYEAYQMEAYNGSLIRHSMNK